MVLHVGLIGYGAIGKLVAEAILNQTHGLNQTRISLAAVLVNRERSQKILGGSN